MPSRGVVLEVSERNFEEVGGKRLRESWLEVSPGNSAGSVLGKSGVLSWRIQLDAP